MNNNAFPQKSQDDSRGMHEIGVKNMDFSTFDTRKMDEYAALAKATRGKTDAYKEHERKTDHLTDEEKNALGKR